MLNVLWSGMILAGVLWGAAAGNLDQVTQGLIGSAKEAVTLGFTMLGIMSFWCGILEIGTRAGLIDWLTGKMGPALDFLFPGVGRDHPARKPIAVNIVANMLGLGMAATPAGIEAMELLAEVADGGAGNEGFQGSEMPGKSERCKSGAESGNHSPGGGQLPHPESGRKSSPVTATDAMCTFLILNVSSLQLIPVTMIAYRSEYGSATPEAVVGPAFAATVCSTLAAILFCKCMDIRHRNRSVR